MTDEQRNEMRDYIELRVSAANQTHEQLMHEMKKSLQELREDVKPMIEMFSNIKWGQRVLIRVGAFLGGFIALIWGIIQIINSIIHYNK